MSSRLLAVLSERDFAQAELAALRLDGEVYQMADCVCPIDEVPDARLRAAALAACLPPRLIAERQSAAWVWGALSPAPHRHQVCADIGARMRPSGEHHVVIREVVIGDYDVLDFGGIKVTTPLRTAIDLARFGSGFDENDRQAISCLMSIGGFGPEDCERVMSRRRNLPGKRLALRRLQAGYLALNPN